MSITKKELEVLVEVRRKLSTEHLKRCSFQINGRDAQDQIAEATRLYRESWILEPLDRIIEKYSMKKIKRLGVRNWELIRMGCKTVGLEECYFFIEERLCVDECETIEAFLKWCVQNKRDFGDANYEAVFAEFLHAKGDHKKKVRFGCPACQREAAVPCMACAADEPCGCQATR